MLGYSTTILIENLVNICNGLLDTEAGKLAVRMALTGRTT